MQFSVRTGAFSKKFWNHDAQRTITTSSVIAISMIVIFSVDVFGQIPSTGNSILPNAVAFENGAVLLDYSDEYGSRASVNWIALGLVDSSSEIGWSSKKLAPFPHDFTFELATNYILQTLAFDTSNTEESSFPGIAARKITVFASIASREGPYAEIFRGEISASELTYITLSAPTEARWLSLSIDSNGGHPEYTELMEFMAFGSPIDKPRQRTGLVGTYQTSWNPFYLVMEGNELRGCYDYDGGVFSGHLVGEFINIEWREYGPQIGKAVMAITENGSAFNGLWYEEGALKGTWKGQKSDDSKEPMCAKKLLAKEISEVEDSLEETGRAVLYGIYFDYDSAVLKPESLTTLTEVVAWLRKNDEENVVFEGHTDSDGLDSYNVALSSLRAESVMQWMIENGIVERRVSYMGFGESQSVASNTTPYGKALNRRVEIRTIQ